MIDMIAMQKLMQEESYGHDFTTMTDEERIQFISWNVLACTDELHEALAETGWKPWATSKHINVEAFQGELIDAWHFLMNLFIAAGMTMEDVQVAYARKHDINRQRQIDGYDGVSTKCPVCGRALDDPAVACTKTECMWHVL